MVKRCYAPGKVDSLLDADFRQELKSTAKAPSPTI